MNSKISGFDRLHECANPLCSSKIHTSGERFEKDAVLVSELFGLCGRKADWLKKYVVLKNVGIHVEGA